MPRIFKPTKTSSTQTSDKWFIPEYKEIGNKHTSVLYLEETPAQFSILLYNQIESLLGYSGLF